MPPGGDRGGHSGGGGHGLAQDGGALLARLPGEGLHALQEALAGLGGAAGGARGLRAGP